MRADYAAEDLSDTCPRFLGIVMQGIAVVFSVTFKGWKVSEIAKAVLPRVDAIALCHTNVPR